MKQDIHPETREIMASCVCGAEFPIITTLPSVRVEICSNCHPFFTGTNKILDTEGRIDKFKNKYARKKQTAS